MSVFSPPRAGRQLVRQAGFSLVEMMIVTAIMGVVTGIAVITIGTSRQGLTGDGAMRVVLAQMNQARELSITKRRNMRLTFVNNNSLQILQEEVPGPTLTAISSVAFEGGLQFLRIASVPDLSPSTNILPPTSEQAAVASPSLSTSSGVSFGATTTQMRFAPDGTLVDQDGLTLNGTLFVAFPNQPLSSRAVAILGSTGRIRGYRWDGAHWRVV